MKTASGPLVSIVTPFYNTAEYLSECMESVLRQSYRNWEYILVDNLSNDGSLEIAQSIANKDPRIGIVRNEHFLNQVQNYNHALSRISPESKYCKVVQADDWIFPDCLEKMVGVAEDHPLVGIVGAYRLDNVRINCDGLPYPSTTVPGKELCRLALLEKLFVFGSATSILIRSDIVRSRKPFYSESSRHEDTEACYEILQAHDFGFVHQVLTFTRRENESLTTQVRQFDPFYLLDHLIAVIKYGRCYLTEAEYAGCLEQAENSYYRFLGERFWSKDRKDLLNYHKIGQANIGHQIRAFKLVEFALLELQRFVLSPNRVLRYLYNRRF